LRAIIQRVSSAKLTISGEIFSKIDAGLLILLGIENEDTTEDADWLSNKCALLRIFSDKEGLMNLSLNEINGEVLVVSQFTLFASTRKGNRPSYIRSAKPDVAEPLYEYFIKQLSSCINKVIKTGVFRADMEINLVNDGPVTIMIDTKQKE